MFRKFETVEEVESKYCSEIFYQNKIYYIIGSKIEYDSIAIFLTSDDDCKKEKEIKVMSEELFENAIFVKNNQPVGVKV
jgi:hypothetical protein